MGDVNTKLTLRGNGESASGMLGVAAGHSPTDILEGYWGQALEAMGSYDPGTKKLTLNVSGARPSFDITVRFTEISPSMAMQLRTVAGGGTVNVKFESVYPSIVGMELG